MTHLAVPPTILNLFKLVIIRLPHFEHQNGLNTFPPRETNISEALLLFTSLLSAFSNWRQALVESYFKFLHEMTNFGIKSELLNFSPDLCECSSQTYYTLDHRVETLFSRIFLEFRSGREKREFVNSSALFSLISFNSEWHIFSLPRSSPHFLQESDQTRLYISWQTSSSSLAPV